MCVVYYLITIYQVTGVTLCTQSLLKKKIVKGDMYIGCKKKKLASPAVTFCIFLRTWIQLVELNKKYLEVRGFNNSQVASISIHL